MRELEDRWKQNFRSTSEVFDFLEKLRLRVLADDSIVLASSSPRAKKPTRAAIMNAVFLAVEAMSPEAQVKLVAEGMRRLNALLRGEPMPPAAGPARLIDLTPPKTNNGKGGKKRGGA